MNEKIKNFLLRLLAFALVFGTAVGVFSAVNTVNAEATSIHVSYKRYTRSSIKFYYYPTRRALGGGLMYQDDGTPTYCIWWSGKTVKDNTLTVSDLEDVVTSEECLEGLYVIMQNGYAGGTNYTVGGIDLGSYGSDADEKEELAYYATSWAIHLWMARYGYEQTTLVQTTANAMTWTASSLRAYGTNGKVSNSTMGAGSSSLSQTAWRASMELLALAVEGEDKTATASVSLNSQTIEGNYNVITLSIKTTNATGWTLAYSTLPSGSSVSKTSGTTSSDTVTVKIPIADTSATYSFTATPNGIGRYVTDSYEYITGTGSLQSLVTWNASFTSTGEPGRISVSTTAAPTASLSLTKVDSSTGDARSGATFTIQEQVTINGTATWKDVGTLTEGSTKGTYDKISLTTYYDTSGTAHTYSTAKTKLVRTRYNSGQFRIKETTAPTGYTAQTNWQWCITVVSAGSWSSVSPTVVLGGSTSGTYVIGKTSASSNTAWHYIKSGSTAYYSNYAGYDDTTNANYNYSTSLGNTGDGIIPSLTKVDGDTGDAVTGAVFAVSELVNGTWYEVGTLTDDDGDGVYSDVSVTCHYNSSGKKKTLSTAQTKLMYTDANTGRYKITEKTPPSGYSAQTGWAWYLKGVPSSQWDSSASSPNSMYKSLYVSTYNEVGYPSSTSKAVWTYVMLGHTVSYSTTAKYDDSGNAAYNLGTKLANTGESAKLSLNKVDNSTGEPVSGAVFTIYEQVNGTWYEVGTLTESKTVPGTYNVIEITKHYDSDGNLITLSASEYESKLVYTDANKGYYKVKETTAPEGFEEQPDWQWCILVTPSASWSSLSPNTVLGGSTSGTYVIGKTSASSTTAWHYIKGSTNASYTAYYSHYATYDDTQNALFNFGTKLGNTPVGIDLTLEKVDSVTGDKLVGAVFSIEEKVNGSWYEVGTLKDPDGDGIYTDITITKHYSSNGEEVTLTQNQTQLIYTDANCGEYRIREITAPDNYEASEDWCWYVTVVAENDWPSGTDTTGLAGTLLASGNQYGSDTWKVMKISDTKAVMYAVQESTADYYYYALFDVNEDNKLVANSNTGYFLGNRGIPAGLSLNKIDYNSEEPISGITFEIQEYVNGTWYTVGTLGESEDTAGTYDVVNITMHYYFDANGTLQSTTLTEADDVIRYTSANGGLYRVVETAVPSGYVLAEDWAWYVQVSSESTLEEASGYGDVLGGSASDGYKVVGLTGTVFAVYSSTDNSLTFYYRTSVPTVNSIYEGKAVTAVYTGFDTDASYASSSDVPWAAYASAVKTVKVADSGISPASMARWFQGFTSCTSIDIGKLDTSNVTSLLGTFMNCSSLTSLDLSSMDTANVTDMSYMLSGDSSLQTITGLDGFDTSKVTSMKAMFRSCSSLTSVVVSSFDTSNVTDMGSMFYGCSSLTSLNVTSFNTAKVTDMQSMFRECEKLTTLNVSSFNTAKVENMSSMFQDCLALKSITGLNKFDTSKATTISYMFYDCSALTSVNVSSFVTSKVTTFSSMFYNCSALTSLDVTNFDVTSATNLYRMFYGCSGITTLNLSSFDTSSVTAMNYMFYGCSKLTTIYVSNKWTTDAVTSGANMFTNCTKLVGVLGTAYTSSHVGYAYAHIDVNCSPGYLTATTIAIYSEDDNSLRFYNTYPVPSVGDTYDGRTVTAVYDSFVNQSGSSSSSGSSANRPWYTYRSEITKVVVEDVISPLDTSCWFMNCVNCTSMDLGNLDTSRVTAMNDMFRECTGMTTLDLSSFDTSNVTDMSRMFYSASSYSTTALTTLNLSSFDTSKVTTMVLMFYDCKNLTTIYAGNSWSTAAITDTYGKLFDSCSSLRGGNGTVYSSSNIGYTYARIDTSSTPGYFTYKAATASLSSSVMAASVENEISSASVESEAESETAAVETTAEEATETSVEEIETETSAEEAAEISAEENETESAESTSELQIEARETTLLQASASAGNYAMVVHYILADETAYYSDYAECDTTEENIAYNYELSDGEWVLANSLTEIELTLYKYDEDNTPLSGAEFTIQEKVGDTWYSIGTLTSSAGNYVYDTVNITCHYDEYGNRTELANAQAGLVLLATNSGTYRVIETKAPNGYYCYTPDEWSWDLTVTETMLANQATQETTLKEKKLDKYAVSVYKLWDDDDNYAGKRPNSVTVTLLQNGKAYGSSVTLSESNGWSYAWTGLPTGYTYTISETATADYTSTTTYTESSMQRVYTLTNTYEPKTTEVTAVKTWEDDDDAAGMRPTSIKVALYADGVKQGDSVTFSESDGWTYTWSDLYYYKKGSTTEKVTYTIIEEEVTGYVQTKTSTTDANGNLTITMTNTITKIPFLKVDTSGKPVTGATLRIIDSKENTVEEWTTDGTAHEVYGLTAGAYLLVESSATDGYLRAASISFTIGEDGKLADGSTVITMTDENTSVNLLKIDAETGKALAGAKLSVTNAETGDEILSWVSGDSSTKASSITVSSSYQNVKTSAQADGSILVTCLPTGEYILNETEAPDGYRVAAEVTFTVTETSTTQSITVEDERYRELRILKTDADGNAVSGATLGLYEGSLTELTEEDEDALVDVWVTDGTAHVLEDIAVGTYTVFELNTPAGYVTADPVTVTITEKSGTVTAVMKDEPIVVSVLKTDKTTGQPLAGATLTVTDAEGNTVVSFVSGSSSVKASSITVGDNYKNQIQTAALSDGSLKLTYLPAGDYTLTETVTPDGYVAAEAISFTVEETTGTQSVTMEDDHTKVQISKTDLTNGTDVPDAVLTVTDESGNTVLTWTTGEVTNGTASITSVTVGSAYKDKIGTAAVVNDDGNWAIEIDYLPIGTYTLTETSVPDGYVKAESVKFTVEETGDIQTVEMQDDVTKLALYKIEKGTLTSETDDDGNIIYSYTAVAGATLSLADSNGNLIVRFVTGDTVTKAEITEIGSTYKNLVYAEATVDGGVILYRLPAGTVCTLTEEETPDGYISSADVTFTFAGTEETVYIFKENDYTKVAVWKVDSETGEELPGALLQIIDANGDVVAEWYSGSEEFVLDDDGNEVLVDSEGNILEDLTQVLNADGTVTVYDAAGNVVTDVTRLTEFVASGEPYEIDRLAAGVYTLHEVLAPENYNLASDIRFQIAADGTVTSLTADVTVTLTDGVYTITMEDIPGVTVKVSKVDENGNPLAGAVLAFYEGDVTEALLNGDDDALAAALVERWTTDGTDHEIEHVKKGTYTIVEEQAPDGYTLTSAMVITVDGTQDPYHITVVNTPEMDMPSTGGSGLMPGIAFAGMIICALGVVLLRRRERTE